MNVVIARSQIMKLAEECLSPEKLEQFEDSTELHDMAQRLIAAWVKSGDEAVPASVSNFTREIERYGMDN